MPNRHCQFGIKIWAQRDHSRIFSAEYALCRLAVRRQVTGTEVIKTKMAGAGA